MDEELNKQLLGDLNKSGFGSEMRAIRQFLNKEGPAEADITISMKTRIRIRKSISRLERRGLKSVERASICW
jgi:hypothetical protein